MMGALDLPPGVVPGTRLGRKPGVVLLLCQCCRLKPQILAEAHQGKLIIESRLHGERHFLVLGPDLCETIGEDRKLWCACCDRETEYARILAECQDGLLIIRSRRHADLHFVAVSRPRLTQLLARGEENG